MNLKIASVTFEGLLQRARAAPHHMIAQGVVALLGTETTYGFELPVVDPDMVSILDGSEDPSPAYQLTPGEARWYAAALLRAADVAEGGRYFEALLAACREMVKRTDADVHVTPTAWIVRAILELLGEDQPCGFEPPCVAERRVHILENNGQRPIIYDFAPQEARWFAAQLLIAADAAEEATPRPSA